jgi:outer membrane protein W
MRNAGAMPGIGLLLLVMTVLCATSVQAQQFYLRAGGGYSIQSGKTEFNNADPNEITGITQSTDVSVDAQGRATVKSLNGTVGEGFKFSLAAGYMFNPYIGVEIGANYFHGSEVTIGKLTTPAGGAEEKAYLRGVDIAPAIVITPGFDKINPYARLGALMTAGGHLAIDTHASQIQQSGGNTTVVNIDAESEVKAKFSVGFIGAVGVFFPLSEKCGVFGEVEFKSFSIQSKEAEIKKYTTTATTNGQTSLVQGQQLSDLSVSEKKFMFEDEYTVTGAQNENEPTRVPKQQVNASGLGLNIGVRYAF